MQSALGLTPARQRGIHPLGLQPCRQGAVLERPAARIDRIPDRDLGIVDRLPRRGPLVCRQAAEPLEQLRQRPFLAEIMDPQAVQLGEIDRRSHGCDGLILHACNVGHQSCLQELPPGFRQARAANRPNKQKRGKAKPFPFCSFA
jgi:hypothetical protein